MSLAIYWTSFVIAATAVVCCFSCDLPFKDCGSVGGKLISVGFNGTCTDSAVLQKKTYVQVSITFGNNEDTAVLKSVVHGIIDKIPVPFPLGDPDACKNSNITCPIQQGKTYSFAPVIYVEPNYPTIRLLVQWELQDANGKDVICVVIPCVISN